MDRIYHPWSEWEDYKAGFYENLSGSEAKTKIAQVVNLFNNQNKLEEFMFKVLTDWPKSCEHNLTNSSLNKIAYIGQGAACLFCGSPSSTTITAWNELSKLVQDEADKIAEKVLNHWIKTQQNA